MDLTKVHTRRRRKEEEEGGGERLAPNKAGPTRPPLLNGIKCGCIVTIGVYYGLDQWLILSQGVGKGFYWNKFRIVDILPIRFIQGHKVHTRFIQQHGKKKRYVSFNCYLFWHDIGTSSIVQGNRG